MATQKRLTGDLVLCFVAEISIPEERKPRLESFEPSTGVR